jgi:hypothetical protein
MRAFVNRVIEAVSTSSRTAEVPSLALTTKVVPLLTSTIGAAKIPWPVPAPTGNVARARRGVDLVEVSVPAPDRLAELRCDWEQALPEHTYSAPEQKTPHTILQLHHKHSWLHSYLRLRLDCRHCSRFSVQRGITDSRRLDALVEGHCPGGRTAELRRHTRRKGHRLPRVRRIL